MWEGIVVFLISYRKASRDDLQNESGRESLPRSRRAQVGVYSEWAVMSDRT